MKLKSTKWFKDFTAWTNGMSWMKFLFGIGATAFGMKNIYEAGGLNVLNRCVRDNGEDDVEEDFDEKIQFK